MAKNKNAKATKTAAAPKAKALTVKRGQQTEIPGTERKTHKDIDDAADEFIAVRTKRKALGRDEKQKKALIAVAMKKHAVELYKFTDAEGDTIEVGLTAEDKVTVRKSTPKPDGDSGESVH